ncbi:hypothetical protein JCM9279_006936 [Rhodotorula babjevae]
MDPRHRLALTDASDDRPGPWQPAPSVAANKVARFAGTTRKSKFELEREAQQQREKAARDDAARAYDEFVEAFGGEEEVGPSRGGRARVGGAGRSKGKGFVRAGGDEKYDPLAGRSQPPPPPAPAAAAPAPGPAPAPSGSRTALQPQAAAFVPKNQPRATAASLMADDDESQIQAPVVPARKKRAGDTFLEQLKRDQAAREERLKQTAGRVGSSITALAAREHAPVLTGSYDVGDPLTTNLHVGGLPPNVTEQSFGKLFAQFGPVGSVKIMWPRLDSGHLAAMGGRKLGGFVAFLRRPDAERAAKEMDGAEWGDNTLKIGWGKAVPIPATAIYEPDYDARSSHRARSRSLSPNLDPHEFLRAKAAAGPLSSASKRARSRSPPRTRAWPQLEDGVDEPFLVAVAKRVRDNGRRFEEVLKEKEGDNARFAFLRDDKLPSYHYFRMLVDPTYEPPLVASFDDEGKASIYSSDSSEYSDDDRVGKGRLSPLAEQRFSSLLRGLTSSRDKIARGMSFALEHADCASYIADLLVCSLTIDTTPVPRKLARLHLVSDILHNSAASVPNAWTYRSIFERKLPAVFDHLGDIYLSFPGRLKAEQFRGLVEKVLDVWANDWIVFEPSVIDDFKRRLAGLDVLPLASSSALEPPVDSASSADGAMHAEPTVALEPAAAPAPAPPHTDLAPSSSHAEPSSRAFKPSFKAASFAPAEPDADADVDGAPVELGGGADDVDGAPVEPELDGAPLDVDVDGEEVDGAPIALDEDVDGAPVEAEKDVDGAPLPPARRETETVVLDGEGDEAMEMGSDDDIFQ